MLGILQASFFRSGGRIHVEKLVQAVQHGGRAGSGTLGGRPIENSQWGSEQQHTSEKGSDFVGQAALR